MIRSVLQSSAFTPDETKQIGLAYEAALAKLKLQHSDPLTLRLAKNIIAVAEAGERDPMSICTLALERLGSRTGGRQFPRFDMWASPTRAFSLRDPFSFIELN